MANLAGALALVLATIATSAFQPARLSNGAALPAVSAGVGGGEVWLELTVNANGGVEDVAPLRVTPSFTGPLRASVATWRFEPAREEGVSVPSRVLVVGSFRPPTLVGPALGEPQKDVAAGSAEVAVPTQNPMPAYPENGFGDATVLVEATVGSDGRVSELRRISGEEPFAAAALDGVRGWRFRPASRAGVPVTATVDIVVGFRNPVVGPPPVKPPQGR